MRTQTKRALTATMITLAAVVAAMLLLPGDSAIAQAPAKGAPAKGKFGKGKFKGKAGKGKGKGKGGFAADIDYPRGLIKKTDLATPGYVLFAPLNSVTSYLVDINGQIVHTWDSTMIPSAWFYPLKNGDFLRGGHEVDTAFTAAAQGGAFQEFNWDGDIVWHHSINDEVRLPHHDVEVLPNGHILAILWERKSFEESNKVGRAEGAVPESGLWPDMLVELEPTRPEGARVVWEWHTWDHLIQDQDPNAPNYGVLSEHPERINVNGDLLDAPVGNGPVSNEIFHTNAVNYNPKLDQVAVSVPRFDEIWIIDHSTTTAEAAGSTGGRYGKGGDLLYRWGNPQIYGRGTEDDKMLGFEHDIKWIDDGLPGAGHLMVFSNRKAPKEGNNSAVMEFIPPMNADGSYRIADGKPYGPAEPVWRYTDEAHLNAFYISGAQRLPNGNTLITDGPNGRFFEVTPGGAVVWDYWSPVQGPAEGLPSGAPNRYASFRSTKILPDDPWLAGHDLSPLNPQPVVPQTEE